MVASPHLKLVAPAGGEDTDAWLTAVCSRFDDREADLIRRALQHVVPVYRERTLAGGEPVLMHVLAVATVVADLDLGHEAVVAALLFRCYDYDDGAAVLLKETFGDIVAMLAEGVAQMAQIGALRSSVDARSSTEQAAQLESLRKMLLAMVQDVRVVLVKLTDHVQTLRHAVKNEDRTFALEAAALTFDIFAPLANRLGMWQIKWELEDLAFRIREPDIYKKIARLLDEKRSDRERYINEIASVLRGELKRAGIAGDVNGRPKHIYSIYKKMRRKDVGFEALYDVRAVRVLVDEVKDCYAVLGIVHNLWAPIPHEFDDYIAKPKRNDYRSLHTAVIGPEDKAVEVQIRTHDMHQASELGVAAHWRYKEGSPRDSRYDEKIAWLRQILDWRNEVGDSGELAERFRSGLFDDVVYVLTPQGRVIVLPRGSTPVDFAYHVHSDLGHRCRGARVDGAMVPLNTPLSNGQRVEIIAAKQGAPSRDWLNPALGYIRSASARARVRQWFNRQNLEAAVAQGRVVVEKELQRHGRTDVGLDRLAQRFGYTRLNDFLADVGRGTIGPRQFQLELRPQPTAEAPAPETELVARPARAAGASGGILVVGVDKLLTVPAKCCKPAPPDAIVGFVSRGRGVTIHRRDCHNVARLDPERLVEADWGAATGDVFAVDIEVLATDRTALLRDISEVLSREKINVTATRTASRNLSARMQFTLEISNLEQLRQVLKLINEVPGVMRATRR
jgi:GTP pyrophosphokinase